MYSPRVTSHFGYERIATLCVFSSHEDNIWEPLVRHDCLTTFVLWIPMVIVEHQTLVHPVHAFTSIWCDCAGWFCCCVERRILGGSSWVQDPVVSHLFIRSHNDSYEVFNPLTMKIRPCKLQWCIPYVMHISQRLLEGLGVNVAKTNEPTSPLTAIMKDDVLPFLFPTTTTNWHHCFLTSWRPTPLPFVSST
jgi:hypothetical protein